MDEVRLHLLGRFRVYRDAQEIPPAAFGGRKARTRLSPDALVGVFTVRVVRILAVRRPDLVTNDALAEALWADRLPADPAGNVNVFVNRARQALGDPASIITGPAGYALGSCWVDATEFLDGVAAAPR
ncbi:MAG: hypothetical protein QOH97_4769, partial [Actinoplanes sp.]|nr:hypothetical protein [Actinoplanes sp.]